MFTQLQLMFTSFKIEIIALLISIAIFLYQHFSKQIRIVRVTNGIGVAAYHMATFTSTIHHI